MPGYLDHYRRLLSGRSASPCVVVGHNRRTCLRRGNITSDRGLQAQLATRIHELVRRAAKDSFNMDMGLSTVIAFVRSFALPLHKKIKGPEERLSSQARLFVCGLLRQSTPRASDLATPPPAANTPPMIAQPLQTMLEDVEEPGFVQESPMRSNSYISLRKNSSDGEMDDTLSVEELPAGKWTPPHLSHDTKEENGISPALRTVLLLVLHQHIGTLNMPSTMPPYQMSTKPGSTTNLPLLLLIELRQASGVGLHSSGRLYQQTATLVMPLPTLFHQSRKLVSTTHSSSLLLTVSQHAPEMSIKSFEQSQVCHR